MLQRRFLRFVVGALLSLPLLLAGGGRASDEITFAIQAESGDQQQPQKSFIIYDNVQQQQKLPPTTYKVISSELLRIGANQKDYPQRFAQQLSAAQQQKQQQQQGAPQYTITDTQRYEIPTQQYYPLQQQQQQESGISVQQNLPQQQQQHYVQTQLRPQTFDQQAQFQQLYRQQPAQLQQQQQQPQQQHQQQLVFQKQPTSGSELAPLNSMKFSPLLASYITNPVEPTNVTIACTICCNLLEDPCTECCSTPLVSQNALKSAAG